MQQLECTAILFDLDGVLIDSTECITRHWEEWARQHGLDIARYHAGCARQADHRDDAHSRTAFSA